MEVEVFTFALRNKIEFGRFSLEIGVKVDFGYVKAGDLKSTRRKLFILTSEKITVAKNCR